MNVREGDAQKGGSVSVRSSFVGVLPPHSSLQKARSAGTFQDSYFHPPGTERIRLHPPLAPAGTAAQALPGADRVSTLAAHVASSRFHRIRLGPISVPIPADPLSLRSSQSAPSAGGDPPVQELAPRAATPNPNTPAARGCASCRRGGRRDYAHPPENQRGARATPQALSLRPKSLVILSATPEAVEHGPQDGALCCRFRLLLSFLFLLDFFFLDIFIIEEKRERGRKPVQNRREQTGTDSNRAQRRLKSPVELGPRSIR